MARQAKLLGQKLKLQQKEDEDAGDEEDGKAEGKLWGASKKAYYADGDEYDVGVLGLLKKGLLGLLGLLACRGSRYASGDRCAAQR